MRKVPPSEYEIARMLAQSKSNDKDKVKEIKKPDHKGSFIIDSKRLINDIFRPNRETR